MVSSWVNMMRKNLINSEGESMKIKVAKKDVKKFKQLTDDFTEWMKKYTPKENYDPTKR